MFRDITMSVVIPFVGLGVVAVVVASVGAAMPVKSRKGTEAAAVWRAFKQYLSNLERYTKVQEATDQFDKYLPYAIAFGIERSWINKFARVEATPIPPWYLPYGYGGHYHHGGPTLAGGGGLGGAPSVQGMSDGLAGSLQSMSNGLTSMLNSAASTFRSTPSSSGSHGGWGGGGFSGGGGGGGGSAGFG